MANPITIDFTAINDGAEYTIAQLNALFASAAVVINGKADAEVAPVGAEVSHQLILSAPMACNYAAVVNLAEGIDDTDAITVAQAKRMLS